MTEEIIAVAGQTRCGSSLVMQMLSAAGLPMTGEYPAFEDMRVFQPEAYAEFNGRCVKLLDIHHNRPPEGHAYRWIWLRRNYREQAKSAIKFLNATDPMANLQNRHIQPLIASFLRGQKDCQKTMNQLGGPVLHLEFENLIERPGESAKRIAEFLSLDAESVNTMVSVVRPRTTECLPYVMEFDLLKETT